MFPWYSNVPQDFTLPEDDRSAVQHLYGPPHEAGAEFPPPPHYPKETLPSVVPTHRTTVLPPGQSVPQKCQTNFDAVAVIRSEMWAFKGKYFWRISREGGTREDPVELSSFWYGLPSDIDHVDAVYERSSHDIVFFVGRKYYVMSGNSQLKHGPLPLTVIQPGRVCCLFFSFYERPSVANNVGESFGHKFLHKKDNGT